ncbi:hypothetical protein ACOSQ4_020347 [Xanthoceras sorbifolium]
MGRRSGGGGGGGNRSNTEILRRRVESCTIKYSNLDGIVGYLRDNYPDYRRSKEKPFLRMVQQTLDRINRSNLTPSPGKKNLRRRVDDDVEERLQSLEKQHIKRRRRNDSSTEEEDSSEEEEEEDGAVSTWEDAIYGEEVEPEFDLMKSMLRESYSESKSGKPKGEEKNVELEVGGGRKLELVNGDNNRGGDVETRKELAKDSVGDVVDVKGKGGPRFRDLGGMGSVLEELKMEVIVPLYHPQLPRWLGVKPMAGILLYGPPGCGKTKLAHAIANETGVPFYKISATEVVSGVSGASEENIRELFSKAYKTAPSIVFIDEIDAIASKRENLQREMEKRIVTQLMSCMDESHRLVQPSDANSNSEASDPRPGYVLVIGATNRPDAVDPALRRPGRFDREIILGVPDENARIEILSVITRDLRLEGSFDLLKIARSTPGFVGADLAALANKAGNLAMKRIIDQRKSEFSGDSLAGEHSNEWWRQPWLPEEMEKLMITMADFEEATKMVQPSSRREGFSAIPNVRWEDVGGLNLLRQEFERYIVRRIKYPEEYAELGVDLETGFLLYGPPGCGKTLIAKAVANEAGANFIHIKGPELLNKYVGESELAVRTLFSRARTCSPCILFFDEVDALTTKRGKEGGWVVERLLNQLLIELDGADQRRGVFVIGATNRPDVMDRAVLRPGRFGKLLYVPLPTADERALILKALARKMPLDANVDLCAVAHMKACESLSGADLSALMNEAAMAALEERLSLTQSCSDPTPMTMKITHFERALSKITPSVSNQQRQRYQTLSESLKAA